MSGIVVFDTETTGVEHGSRIVELAAIHVSPEGEIADSYQAMLRPGIPMPADVSKLNGITDASLRDASDTALVLDQWNAWLRGVAADTLCAHNAPFDMGMLHYAYGRCGIENITRTMTVLDTCAMAREIRETPKNSLAVLMEHYGIARGGLAHRALSDVYGCHHYYQQVARKKLPDWQAPAWEPAYWYPDTDTLPERVACLPQLARDGAEYRFDYIDSRGAASSRSVIIYGYAQTNDGLYFHGLDTSKNERRTFRADRVQ